MISEETRQKIIEARKRQIMLRGSQHSRWKGEKGDNIDLPMLHNWIRKWMPRPEFCEICNVKKPYDLANINIKYNCDTYNRDFKNWGWLCRKCHQISDGRASRRDPKTGRWIASG
jgi:hypothetical protein